MKFLKNVNTEVLESVTSVTKKLNKNNILFMTTAVACFCINSQQTINAETFNKQVWYDEYINQKYLTITKFNELYKLCEKYNVDINNIKEVEFKLTAYSSLPEENGGYNVTCKGEPLEGNIVANNTLPQGTKVILEGIEYVVADRGSKRFDNPYRLDILIERNEGETDDEYRKRVSDYGVKHIKGYIIYK